IFDRALSDDGLVAMTSRGFADLDQELRLAVEAALPLEADLTVNIPSDFPTLQAAIDKLSGRPVKQGVQIILSIESGHALTAGLSVENGDYSHFVIRSVDAEVPLQAGFAGMVISGSNAAMPVLDCLIDAAAQTSGGGVKVDNASRMHITAGAGIKNVWGNG